MIYAIRTLNLDFVKFGLCAQENINTRLSILQVGCPIELRLMATADWYDSDEQRIHRYLYASNIRGEWFSLDAEANQIIDLMLDEVEGRERFLALFLAKSNHKRLGTVLTHAKASVHKILGN